MLAKQISVFLENKTGRLVEITKLLSSKDIDIGALSIADTHDFGILRLVVNKPDEAEKVLFEKGFTVSSTSIISIAVENKPGGLAYALDILGSEGLGVDYVYTFLGRLENRVVLILKVGDPDKAIQTFTKKNIRVLSSKELYSLT